MTRFNNDESYEGKNSHGESVSITHASDIVGGWYLYVNGTLRDWADTKRELVRMQSALWGVSITL